MLPAANFIPTTVGQILQYDFPTKYSAPTPAPSCVHLSKPPHPVPSQCTEMRTISISPTATRIELRRSHFNPNVVTVAAGFVTGSFMKKSHQHL